MAARCLLMQSSLIRSRGWQAYMLLMLAFNAIIWVGPVLQMAHSPLAEPLYAGLGYTCHQLDSRSICLFPNSTRLITDCSLQDGKFHPYKNEIVPGIPLGYADGYPLYSNGPIGYKVPVCARDIGIYGGMVLGGLLWLWLIPRLKMDPADWPHPIWLIWALIPLAIDGFTQLFGWQESSNAVRLWTGLLVGVAMAFYALPSFYILLRSEKGKKTKENEQTPGKSGSKST